jgi:thiol-disulfide isomerase/thioredoxin
MKKLNSYFKSYFKKSSWFKIITDILFYLFIFLMIIPPTRRSLSEIFIKATMTSPGIKTESPVQFLDNEDYRQKITDLNGIPYLISDFQGKVILINFWATWCPPCRAEMSSFQKLYNEYRKEIVFLFIAQDEKEKIQKYFLENNYFLPVYFLQSTSSQNFAINSIPTTMVINRQGGIAVYKKGAADWNSAAFKEKLDILIKE